MTEQMPDVEYEHILYKNSGDTDFGDKSRVVGYNSIVVSKKELKNNSDEFVLTEKDKKDLIEISRTTMSEYIINKEIPKNKNRYLF